LEDEPGYVQMNPKDCEKLGIKDKHLLWVKSRRGKILARCWSSDRVKPGDTCMTYQWWIGACNELTTNFMDPIASTPEYKYCAVNLEKIDDQKWAEKYLKDTYSKLKAEMRVEAGKR
jgi:formate dehydrogenase major subunit